MTTEVSNLAPDETPRRQLTAEEFIEIITMKDKKKWSEYYIKDYLLHGIIIDSIIISDEVSLSSDITIPFSLKLQNSVFEGLFCINGARFNSSFIIASCNFKYIFSVESGSFHDTFEIESGEFHDDFTILGGVFYKTFKIKDGSFYADLWFCEGEFSKYLIIEGGTYHSTFQFAGGNYKDSVFISGGIFQSQLIISDGTLHKIFNISGGDFYDEFIFSGGDFYDLIIISNGNFTQGLKFIGGHFHGFLNFQGGIFYDIISINYSNFYTGIHLFNAELKKEIIIGESYLHKLHIQDFSSKLLLTTNINSIINCLVIENIIAKESLLRFSSKFYLIAFHNTQNFGTIVFADIHIQQELYVPKEGSMPLDRSPFPLFPVFEIFKSDLSKTSLINCDLSGYYLHFNSSRITDVFVTGTIMPKEIVAESKDQKQLGYSQIKKIYEARGDKIEANRYYAKEMEAYLSTLSWRKDFWEKINLCANKYSTDYGQSWERGLSTTVIVSLVFYIPYCLLLGFYLEIEGLFTWINSPILRSITYPLVEVQLNKFGEICSLFLEFINPIRKPDYIAEMLLKSKDSVSLSTKQEVIQISSWARGLESISRIVIAYCVYQLVQAFRKHGKP